MKADDRLHAAHLAALEGQHEEALREYVWFHDHALDEQPSLYGVRLFWAYVHNYADDVSLLISVLEGAGRSAEGTRIEALALELLDSASVRKAVKRALSEKPQFEP